MEHINSRKTSYNGVKISFYTRAIFAFFTFLWILIVVLGKFYDSFASLVLLLPFGYYFIGFMNADNICTKEIEDDVFSTSFINTGMLLSLPLIAMFNKDESKTEDKTKEESDKVKKKNDTYKRTTHIIFLAMILVLISYPHIWATMEFRHVFKIARSCIETMAVTLYIFVLMIFFLGDNENK